MTVSKIPHRNIALVLAAALLSASAATAQAAPRLPNTMLGHWCFSRYLQFATDDIDYDQNVTLLNKTDNFDCANLGGVRFWQRGGKSGYQIGRFDYRNDCKISKIERVASKGPNVYRVHSHCRDKHRDVAGGPLKGTRLFELWQSKAGLRWRE
jgi:hypothetical protein